MIVRRDRGYAASPGLRCWPVIDQMKDLVYYLVMKPQRHVEVKIHEAKTHLSRLLEQAMAGDDITICKGGRAMVRLVPVETAPKRRELGTAKGDFVVPADFDAPLPDSVLDEFEK